MKPRRYLLFPRSPRSPDAGWYQLVLGFTASKAFLFHDREVVRPTTLALNLTPSTAQPHKLMTDIFKLSLALAVTGQVREQHVILEVGEFW
jgi:hypothetical protein